MATLNIQSFPGEVKISSNLTTDNDSFIVNDVENRVGINTASPSYPLDVNGPVMFQRTGTGVNVLTLKNGDDQLVIKNTNGTNGQIYSYDSGTSSYNKLQLNEDMTILANSNVGIGSSIPTAPLDVKSGDINAEMIAGNIKFGGINADQVLLGYRGRTINGLSVNSSGAVSINTNDSNYGEVQFHENGGFKFGLRNDAAGSFKFSAGSLAPAQKLHVNGYASTQSGIVKTEIARRETNGNYGNTSYTTIHTHDFTMVDTGSKNKRILIVATWNAGQINYYQDSCYFRITSEQVGVTGKAERNYLEHKHLNGTGGGARGHGNCLIGWSPDVAGHYTGIMRVRIETAISGGDDPIFVNQCTTTLMQIVDPI